MAEVEEFGEGLPDVTGRVRNPNVRWLGAKFDLTNDEDATIVEMSDVLAGRVGGGMKRLIAALVKYAYQREVKK